MTSPQLARLAAALAPAEGYNPTALPGVRMLRSDRPLARTPVLYDPGIVFVCQGCKRGYFGGDVYVYDAEHYLAVSVPVPFDMETDATPQRPLLALYLHLDFALAADLMLHIDRAGPPPVQAPRTMMSSRIDGTLRATLLRFLAALAQPLEAAVLAPGLLRELYFRVLTGPQGGPLRAALAQRGQYGKIGRALQLIHARYAEPLDLAQLARAAGMSVPSFHSHFKAITRTSPMQYLKSARLHQARLLMVRQDLTADGACRAVGYTSASQFGREFKRLFGVTPAAETKRMRERFAIAPPGRADSAYIASH
ncbi:transcriptional regulator, AraC family [Pseudoduganella flava]|uniref:Helix-turn-helix domain-containing protein n=1 Tax=Pseudoduganella flava TaxID=871742 RepID=A0A562Q0X2_9BURK|nr:AraC family transcriptional regulator [Pseudoduganella flava]QGZ38138.1 helix-turn-helix domain-containing protein [Pseudoduganella flava]TWI50345.1 transcriptional regulator, AraC family [Pseudoduganella flava]